MRQVQKKSSKPNKVLVFGVFDLLHPGHKYFLKQARKYGRRLVVVVARDQVVKVIKKSKPKQNQTIRLNNIKKLPFVYQARLGDKTKDHRHHMIKLIKPETICLGYDQKPNLTKTLAELKKHGLKPRFIRLKPYHPQKYKSSLIKNSSNQKD